MEEHSIWCSSRFYLRTIAFQYIYINDLFLFSSTFNIANYADDCFPYEFSDSINDVISKLENDSITLIKWYDCNYLMPNPEKWHLLLNVTRDDLSVTVGNNYVLNTSCEKNLGVYFDNKLSFDIHVAKLCKKAAQKLHALAIEIYKALHNLSPPLMSELFQLKEVKYNLR